MLPHDIDAEQALLGSLLVADKDSPVRSEAIAALPDGGRMFFYEQHRGLFDLIAAMVREGREPDAVVIREELVRRGVFEKWGGLAMSDLVSTMQKTCWMP